MPQICQRCFSDMYLVYGDRIKFVCESMCGYEDTSWQKVERNKSSEERNEINGKEKGKARISELGRS